jgi:hypothetical protein
MPNARQLTALAAIVGCDVRTVRAFFEGRRVLPIYATAIERAWASVVAGEPLTIAVADRGDFGGPGIRREA